MLHDLCQWTRKCKKFLLFSINFNVLVNALIQQETLGHTEDALSENLNNFYIVSAHIISDSPQGKYNVTEERFTSLCYAGHLPGYTMNYNHHGLVFSINTLSANKLNSGKTRKILKSFLWSVKQSWAFFDIFSSTPLHHESFAVCWEFFSSPAGFERYWSWCRWRLFHQHDFPEVRTNKLKNKSRNV